MRVSVGLLLALTGCASDRFSTVDASDATTDGSAVDGGCGVHPGPTMVSVGSYCIDSTEITRRQWAEFIKAIRPDGTASVAGDIPAIAARHQCDWNLGYGFAGPPSTEPELPKTNINWCQALGYCLWAGKTLCGAIDGGPDPDYRDAAVSAWGNACSHGGAFSYPYGHLYVPTNCNTTGSIADAGAFPLCEGGFPGIFDMSGNVQEWTDSCKFVDDAGGDQCVLRGGGFGGNPMTGAFNCAAGPMDSRSRPRNDTGFRCCSK